MPKTNLHNIILPALALAIAALSCISSPGDAPPWGEGGEEQQDINQITCDATAYLYVASEITLQETNQFGTRGCEYKLKVRNTAPSTVHFYIYQHDKDGYAHTEKSHWMGNIPVAPGAEGEWTGSIYIYTDKDADGPAMSIPEKIAGVFDTPECAEERQSTTFFEQSAVPVDPVCPME